MEVEKEERVDIELPTFYKAGLREPIKEEKPKQESEPLKWKVERPHKE
jgi:hypothetical protein